MAKHDQAEGQASATLPKDSFVVEINPEVEEAVTQTMELAQKGKMKSARVAMARLLAEYPANHLVFFRYGGSPYYSRRAVSP